MIVLIFSHNATLLRGILELRTPFDPRPPSNKYWSAFFPTLSRPCLGCTHWGNNENDDLVIIQPCWLKVNLIGSYEYQYNPEHLYRRARTISTKNRHCAKTKLLYVIELYSYNPPCWMSSSSINTMSANICCVYLSRPKNIDKTRDFWSTL